MMDPRTLSDEERRAFWINVYADMASALILGIVVALIHSSRRAA